MSENLDTKFPEINYDRAKVEMYEYLENDAESPFYNQTKASIFIFAMALAKRKKLLPEDLKKPAKLPPGAFNDIMRSLMRSIMITEKNDVYSIKDNLALRSMCQRYANAGIDVLYLTVKNKPSWEKPKEDVLVDLIQSSVNM